MIRVSQPLVGEEELAKLSEVVMSGFVSPGRMVKDFEKKFADYCGAEYCVATNSGTAALHTALESLGLGEGDEVITTPFSFVSTGDAIRYCGAKPVFVDIDSRTYNINPELIEGAITDRAKAVLPVHLYGLPANMPEINRVAEKHGLRVVEDACQAHGAEIQGKRMGSLSDLACFSFYATKNMTTGKGGAVITNDKGLYEACKLFAHQGSSKKNEFVELGFNYGMSELSAAMGLAQLEKLDSFNEKRINNARVLTKGLKGFVKTPFVPEGFRHVFHQYVIQVDDREVFREKMRREGVQTLVHYPTPIHEQPSYNINEEFPVSEACSERVVSLPVHPGLSDDDLGKIVSAVISCLE